MVNNKHNIESVKCPTCGGINHYIFDTGGKNFYFDGTGYISFVHYCRNCDNSFRSLTKFIYEITEQTTTKQ